MSVPDDNAKVIFIGAGHVAVHLSAAMRDAGFAVVQVFSRTEESARMLGEKLSCDFTTDAGRIRTDAGIYVFTVRDDVLPDMIARMPANGGLWIHTAGSVPADVFEGRAEHYGVMYPLQTLSKDCATDFRRIPLFVEGRTEACEREVRDIAEKISEDVRTMDSGKRKYLHLAAVFACNFSNHMFHIATRILEAQGIDRHVLLPLIDETAGKLHALHPGTAQTGPAVRYDLGVISRHLAMLEHDPEVRSLYGLISKNIKLYSINNMINYDLKRIKAFVFDVDGVLSSNRISLATDGDPMRTVNIKDGYALQLAVREGFEIGIITGGYSEAVRIRYERLGIRHIYMRSSVKVNDYEAFLLVTGLSDDDVMYCGDDIPDYEIMRRVALPVAPADAAPEIRALAKYVSPVNGGEGVARDIIEQVMKAQGRWMTGEAFGW